MITGWSNGVDRMQGHKNYADNTHLSISVKLPDGKEYNANTAMDAWDEICERLNNGI